MITLDSDYNSQDWNTFTSDTQIMLRYLAPISQIQQEKCNNHRQESMEFAKIFPNNHLISDPRYL
jgi:hypothetical protein